MSNDTVVCRTPNVPTGKGTRIPRWKYDVIAAAITETVSAAGDEGLLFRDLTAAVRASLSPEQQEKLGSVSWHTTSVKLEMEVRGDLARVPGTSPQRLRIDPLTSAKP